MAQKKTKSTSVQLPLWAPRSDWTPPSMSDLPSWSKARRVAIDCETHDPHLKELGIGVRRDCAVGGSGVVGVSFALEDGPKFYLPFRHKGGDNLPEAQVLGYLRENAASFSGELCGANLSYDLDYLWEEDLAFPQVEFYRDVQIADPLIHELHDSYSLNNILKRHGMPQKNEDLLKEAAQAHNVSPKDGMWKLGGRYVGPYAEDDAALVLPLLRRQERLIEENDLWRIYNLESQVLPVLVRMRRRGVRIDTDKLQQIEEWSLTQESEALQLIRDRTGVNIAVGNVWKADALAPALEHIGIKLLKTSQGQPNIDKALLAGINHPVATAMAHARKVNKLRTTFAASVRRYMVQGRIHCTFNQIARETESGDMRGARYGRLSATDPNMQQQPSRDEFAKLWRSIYLPEEGTSWACLDYSQQEPRWTTHFAAMIDLPGAKEAAKAYHDNPDLDNHQFMADLTNIDRKFAKSIYLGICYGEGGGKLCRDLGLPSRWAVSTGRGSSRSVEHFDTREQALEYRRGLQAEHFFMWEAAGAEGQSILDMFDTRAPFIRQLAKKVEKRAKERGYIITAGGRKLHFPQRPDGGYDFTHKALNRLIQGTSADQAKQAMVTMDKAGHWMMMQAHDELDTCVQDRAEAEAGAAIMRDAMPALVPFKVDVEIGHSWGEIS